jgi:hypothetical protein
LVLWFGDAAADVFGCARITDELKCSCARVDAADGLMCLAVGQRTWFVRAGCQPTTLFRSNPCSGGWSSAPASRTACVSGAILAPGVLCARVDGADGLILRPRLYCRRMAWWFALRSLASDLVPSCRRLCDKGLLVASASADGLFQGSRALEEVASAASMIRRSGLSVRVDANGGGIRLVGLL